ncbi:hypothetical protein HK104_005418 [Borealophlyctis nickersoniae]|nr:hypothetical protein HK104_005418 [Borealophlyctis nickersoniae]
MFIPRASRLRSLRSPLYWIALLVGGTVLLCYSQIITSFHTAPTPAIVENALVKIPSLSPASLLSPPRPQQQQPSQKVHFLIAITKPSPKFCRTLSTILLHEGYEPVLLNYGRHSELKHVNKVRKLQGTYEYLLRNTTASRLLDSPEYTPPSKNSHPADDDIVIMIDGLDVWIQAALPSLLAKFRAQPYRIVFGADKKCWPNPPRSPECTNVPQSTLPADIFGKKTDTGHLEGKVNVNFQYNRPRWVNSGTIIGYATDLAILYRDVMAYVTPRAKQLKSDQFVVAQFFTRGIYNITLDYTGTMFQTMAFSHADVEFTKPLKVVRNKLTGETPSFVHFNGWKPPFETWWNKTWWGRKSRAEWLEILRTKTVRVDVDGRELGWDEICSGENDFLAPRK